MRTMRTVGGARLLKHLMAAHDGGDWPEYVQWACNYDVKKELLAWCLGEDVTTEDIEHDTAALE